VDLPPTVLDVVGLPIPEGIPGRSLASGTDSLGSREVFAESFRWTRFSRLDRVERAIFSGHMKFISSTAGKRELYNLAEDPEEMENLYREDGESIELERRLNEWLETTEAMTDPIPALDNESIERIKSLGYAK
jgi:arylsulfatase A-like enzyme